MTACSIVHSAEKMVVVLYEKMTDVLFGIKKIFDLILR